MPVEARTCEATLGDHHPGGNHPPCPICGGGLVPLRGTWRCARCSFLLCVGCDPGVFCAVAEADDE
jgi:hypothetical protein